MLLNGDGVSRGIAIGPIRVLHEIQPTVRSKKIDAHKRPAELRRFRKALASAEQDLLLAKVQLPASGSAAVAGILDSHIAMLHDPGLIDPIENLISEHRYSVEWALAHHRDELLGIFDSIDDPYIRERTIDIEETFSRLLKYLGKTGRKRSAATGKSDKFILVSSSLAPSDLIQQMQLGLIGAITEEGSPLSHTTIIAKNLGIPLIVNVRLAMNLLEESDETIVDGRLGTVIVGAGSNALRNFKDIRKSRHRARRNLATLTSKITYSNDRHRVQVMANIGSLTDISTARKAGAEGVGLFRTESLFLNRDTLPDEEEQFRLYKGAVNRMHGDPLIIRTMDIWASSRTPGLEQFVPRSPQPALGLRAIRMCLRYPDIFLPQLRALLRAAHHGPIALLVPMISGAQEIRDLRQLVETTKVHLKRERRVFDENLKIGAMIEVPSAAISARIIAPFVDFMAIGSNDLAQYTLAMDRDDSYVQPLFDPLNPAILQLIREVIKAGDQFNTPVSICGEMAGEPLYTRLLLGLGLRELSMHPSSVLEVKAKIMGTNILEVEKLSRALLRAGSPQRSRVLLDKINALEF